MFLATDTKGLAEFCSFKLTRYPFVPNSGGYDKEGLSFLLKKHKLGAVNSWGSIFNQWTVGGLSPSPTPPQFPPLNSAFETYANEQLTFRM